MFVSHTTVHMTSLQLRKLQKDTDQVSVLSLQIYTDWANHYLAKSGCPRLIKDLSQDITDGVLLAQIIQIIGKYPYPHPHLSGEGPSARQKLDLS